MNNPQKIINNLSPDDALAILRQLIVQDGKLVEALERQQVQTFITEGMPTWARTLLAREW